MKVKLEYVWLDGYKPEPNLRSKVKIVSYDTIKGKRNELVFPTWNFDGSSTNQADTGNSDRLLKPVRHYMTDFQNTIYVLCEVLNPDGTPHQTNQRAQLKEEDENLWFGFEQEYFIREEINGNILGHKRNILKGQGEYYCGVGHNVVGREFVEEHTDMCLSHGIDIHGSNSWQRRIPCTYSSGKVAPSKANRNHDDGGRTSLRPHGRCVRIAG